MSEFLKDNFIFKSFILINVITLLFFFGLNYTAIWFSDFTNGEIDSLNISLLGDFVLVTYSFISIRLIYNYLKNF